MRTWNLPNSVVAALGAALVALLANSVLSFTNSRVVIGNYAAVMQTHDALTALNDLLSTLKDAETGQRGFLLTGREDYLQPYNEAAARVQGALARVRETLPDTPAADRLAAIESQVKGKLGELQRTIALRRTAGFDAAVKVVGTDRGKHLMDDLRATVAAAEKQVEARRTALIDEAESSDHRLMQMLLIGGAAHLALFALLGFAVNRDLSARIRAQAEIREQAERLRVTLASIGDAVIVTDPSGSVVMLNGVAETLTGWGRPEAAGRRLTEVFCIVNEETRRPVENPVDKVLETGVVVGLANHTVVIARDGKERPIDDSAAPIRDAEGKLIGVVLVFRDITARKAAEAERGELLRREQAARREAETANRLKDEFLWTLSHELRTPLNAIVGWVQLLRSGEMDPRQTQDGLEVIDRNSHSLTALIKDLTDLSRIASGKLVMDVRTVEPAAFVQAAADSVRLSARAKGVEIESSVPSDLGRMVGDPDRLQQVVWNLLSNAVKFTPKGGRIDLRAERRDSRLLITVADTGAGIRPDFLAYVFERFRQADSSITRRFGGLGLGLAIVKHIVEAHGGTVQAASEGEGRGAKFTVTLPVAESPAPANSPDPSAPAA